MRPVKVTNPPPDTYDEDAQLKVLAYQGNDSKKRNRYRTIIKQNIVEDLTAIIDQWVDDGATLTPQRTPKFKKNETKEAYDECMSLLSNGGHDWGDARRALIGMLGQYCCYCGSPIFSHLAIEHVLPKSSFPAGIYAWSNFLLACTSCNSAKSNEPNQGTLPDSPMSTADATAYIMNQNANNYLWPNFNWDSLRIAPLYPFRFQLRWTESYRNKVTFGKEVSYQESQELLQLYRTGNLPSDRSFYYLPISTRGKRCFGVCMEPRSDLSWAADEVIELASLNRVVSASESSKSVDRRILNRTTAWFRALILRDQISAALRSGDKQLTDAVVAMARITIKNTGFWPVWLQVLGNTFIGGQTTQAFLRSIFPATSDVVWRIN